MKSIIDNLLNYGVVDRNGIIIKEGDWFLASFIDEDHGPFKIITLTSYSITYQDTATGQVLTRDMKVFGTLLEHYIFKVNR